jgi:chromate transporter
VTEHILLLFTLAWHFALFSLFTIGGGVSMLIPQMRQEFVLQYHWLDERSLSELIAVAQAAPGPNFLLMPLIGWRIAALPGLAVALFSFLLLPVVLTTYVSRVLKRHDSPWVARFRRAFQPVTCGLWTASGIVLGLATDHTYVNAALTLGVVALALRFDISPLWWCLIAGVAGALFA